MTMWKSCVALAVSVGVGLLPGVVRADELPPPPSTIVLLHPVNRLGVGVERAVGSHVALAASLTGDFALYGTRFNESSTSSSRNWSVGFEPGVHVYVSGHAPDGFWVGAHLEAALFHSLSDGYALGSDGQSAVLVSNTYSLGGSARVGYTAILTPGLTLQAGLGIGVANTRLLPGGDDPGVINTMRPPAWAVAPRLSFGLGWAL